MLHTWVVVDFAATEDGTMITLSYLGWPESGLEDPDSQWPGTFAYFEEAGTFVMDLFSGQFSEPA